MRVQVEAPAKLNLHLKVGDRRSDGFHNIESLFCALTFGDTLYVETVTEGGALTEICMNGLDEPLPPEQNIISKAVSLFRNRTGFDAGLKITVEKRIPLGGGLGGGSSDAAATLLALNRLAALMESASVSAPVGAPLGAPLGDVDLAEMGASLGSDVPFFLSGAPAAWVSGRGEHVRPLELPDSARRLSLVLVNPGFPSDTAGAFRLFDLWRKEHTPAPPQSTEFLLKSFADPPDKWPFTNDFLPVFTDSNGAGAIYQQIISCLREGGADFTGLSGSGSTCFGVYSATEKAELAKKFLLEHQLSVINAFFTCVTSNTIVQYG